jgi:CheY-like chemotaxis protein
MSTTTRTVLCVDDDVDDREVVCITIEEIDPSLHVVHAADGVEALGYLSKAKQDNSLPCLVILDINMPRMDGKQTLAEIKKDSKLREVPVVVFSTSNNPEDKTYCERYGVELITKPSTMHTMLQEVKKLLEPCMKE